MQIWQWNSKYAFWIVYKADFFTHRVGLYKWGTLSFCSVSDCLQHGPSSIWAHLHPVLEYLRFETCTRCPSTQYRNKVNFYLLAKKIFDYGFTWATWNLTSSKPAMEKVLQMELGQSLSGQLMDMLNKGATLRDQMIFNGIRVQRDISGTGNYRTPDKGDRWWLANICEIHCKNHEIHQVFGIILSIFYSYVLYNKCYIILEMQWTYMYMFTRPTLELMFSYVFNR